MEVRKTMHQVGEPIQLKGLLDIYKPHWCITSPPEQISPYFSTSSCSSTLPSFCNSLTTTDPFSLSDLFRSLPSIALALAARSLTCLSPLSGLSLSKLSSNRYKYSLFSPLGPRDRKICAASESGSCGPVNCGFSGKPM